MALVPRILALTSSIALGANLLTASATAANTTTTFPLRGTKMASMAHGVAAVVQTAPGDYKVTITLSAMPVPSTLKTTPIRHAYVAWAINAALMRPPTKAGSKPPQGGKNSGRRSSPLMGAVSIPLHATSTSTYTGTGIVMMKQIPAILVTAEVSAKVHTPATPLWGVLIGRPGTM
jgi:hypothetical protein